MAKYAKLFAANGHIGWIPQWEAEAKAKAFPAARVFRGGGRNGWISRIDLPCEMAVGNQPSAKVSRTITAEFCGPRKALWAHVPMVRFASENQKRTCPPATAHDATQRMTGNANLPSQYTASK